LILVDERIGSREQLQTLRGLGVDAELGGKMDSDFQFTGYGPDGAVLSLGIERKSIQDLLNSMRDRRLAGQQLGRMIDTYDVCYLVVEGIWRRGRGTGMVEILQRDWRASRGGHRYAEVDRFLCSLEELTGLRLRRTADEEETCAAIADLYLWWQKPYESHTSTRVIYAPGPTIKQKGNRPKLFRHEATLLEKWVVALPGVDDRAIEIAKNFSSPRDMANADIDRWAAIHGQRVGRKTAQNIVEAISAEV
jgi:ERCC4-type nuclease